MAAQQSESKSTTSIRVLGVLFPKASLPKLSRVGEKRRNSILDATITLFRKKGFHGASIDEIGEAAGVKGPAIYHYFKSKNEILHAVFLRLGDSMLREVLQKLDGLTKAKEIMDVLIDSHVEALWKNREMFPLLYQEFNNLAKEEQTESAERRRFWSKIWTTTLNELRPELTVEVCETMVQGALWLIHSVAFYEVKADPKNTKAILKNMSKAALFKTPANSEN